MVKIEINGEKGGPIVGITADGRIWQAGVKLRPNSLPELGQPQEGIFPPADIKEEAGHGGPIGVSPDGGNPSIKNIPALPTTHFKRGRNNRNIDYNTL